MALKNEEIRKGVSDFYAGLVKEKGSGRSCCCSPDTGTGIAEQMGYTKSDLENIPREATDSSFGCGNPLAFAEVRPGEIVLDLGSGAGIDCFLAAERVGKTGKVIGLDMTEEMLATATKTAEQNGYGNVEFRLGKIEDMPVETASVDWVISNCVINLSPEKKRVFAEAYRVLRSGGRLLISDVVAENLPDAIREDISAWASCVAGALTEREYLEMIRKAGFEEVDVVDRIDHVKQSEDQPYRISSIRVRGIKKETARQQESTMKSSLTALDRETQLLVAAGSAVAAGCMPCLETIVGMARADGIDEKKLKEAVMTGQYVKEQPSNMMKKFADELVGTHLHSQSVSADGDCPLSKDANKDAGSGQPAAEGRATAGGCGCSSAKE